MSALKSCHVTSRHITACHVVSLTASIRLGYTNNTSRVAEKRQLEDIHRRMESEDVGEWALALVDYMMVLAQQNVLVAIATLLALLAVPVVALTHMITGPVVIDVDAGAGAGAGAGADTDTGAGKAKVD